MSDFQTSDHGLLQAAIATPFKRIVDGEAVGKFYCVVDMTVDDSSTFAAGCETYLGDAPQAGDNISQSGTFGQFTKLVVNGTVFAYQMP